MSIEENKAVVRRFMTEVLEGQNLAVLDEVAATNYVNTALGGADLAGFKGILGAMAAAVSGMRFTIQDLVADGDVVVARFTSEVTEVSGPLLPGVGVGSIITGQVEVDLAHFPPDSDDIDQLVLVGNYQPEEFSQRHVRTGLGVPLFALRVRRGDGRPFLLPHECADGEAFDEQQLELTEAGAAVLRGEADYVELNGIDRWLGGVYLYGTKAAWRWDAGTRQLTNH